MPEKYSFLLNDFNQCFQQLRHYDSQIVDIFKWGFALYTFIIATSIGLYQFGKEKVIDFSLSTTALLLLGVINGFILLMLMIRNRKYYVRVCRYINEQRCFFFEKLQTNFENLSGMYVDRQYPEYVNWRSTHSFFLYICTLFNSLLLSVAIYKNLKPNLISGLIALLLFVISIGMQLKLIHFQLTKSS